MKKIFEKTKRIVAMILTAVAVLSLNIAPVCAAETDFNPPVIIGEFDGWLSECLETEDTMTRASVVNVRVNSYATYDSKKGINVIVKLYAPAGGTQPKFTGMTGTVTVNMNKKNTVKNFSKVATGSKTISSTVKTGVTAKSGTKGTVTVSGGATALNALFGGGAFGISYGVTIP